MHSNATTLFNTSLFTWGLKCINTWFLKMETEKLSSFITEFERLTSKPEKYLSLQEDEAEAIKLLTKNLYDFTKENEDSQNKSIDVLEKLVISNLDDEEIWQQIELQNQSVCNSLVSDVAHLLAKKSNLKFPIKKEKKKNLQPTGNHEIKENEIVKEKMILTQTKKNSNRQKIKSSIIDDKFFKLHEMEDFLEKVEKKEESNEDDDAEIDYFEEDSSTFNDESESQLHYNDFFDQPEDITEENSEDDCSTLSDEKSKGKKVKFMLDKEDEEEDSTEDSEKNENTDESLNFNDLEDSDDTDDYGNNNEDGSVDGNNDDDNDVDDEEDDKCLNKNGINESAKPSTFEVRQERLKTRIKNLEEKALSEKPWQLKGEVTANSRPQNSLLEEYVEFDIASRPAPVLTEKSTLKLEDIIIQRIKDKAWDDVVRKIKPNEKDIEYKKKLVLDQEKSKLSLAQIYEQEYLRQLDSKNEGVIDKPEMEAPEHEEIRIMMNKLFSKLDALSNFHFTPKQVEAEVKVISNMPAITMEEVTPIGVSDAMLLAPEEVKSKSKGDLIGKSERTTTDKKRERRQKKLKQKLKYKKIEAKGNLKLGKPDSKDLQERKISQKFLQEITKSSNVSQFDRSEGGKFVKSSNAFFSKLQDQTTGLINKKKFDGNKIKKGKKDSSKKPRSR